MTLLLNYIKTNPNTIKVKPSILLRFIALLLSVLLINTKIWSQFYPAKLYSIRDGMPTNAIYDITQSTDGIMWFLTSKGVVNYNSLDWKLYPDSLKLPNSPYSFIKSLSDGSIWVAGQNRDGFTIKYFKNDRWNTVNLEALQEIKGKFTFDVKITENRYSVVIARNQLLTIINTQTASIQNLPLSDPKPIHINAVSFHDDKIYVSTSNGLLVHSNSFKSHPVNESLNGKTEVLQINWDQDDLYLLGINWVGKYSDGKFSYLNDNTGVNQSSQFNKHNLAIDQFSRIFFSSASSARFLDPTSAKSEILFVNGRIFNAKSNKIFVDAENNIWVGDHRGLFKFNVLRFQNYNENIGLADDEVTAISIYKNQLVLANKNHLNFLEGGSVKKTIRLNFREGIRILDLAFDDQDKIFLATNSAGLQMYDGNKVTNINIPPIGQKLVTSVESIKGAIFFATKDALFSYKNGNIIKEAEVPNIRNINYIPSDEIIALSTYDGLCFYSIVANTLQRFTSKSLNFRNVYSVCKWNNKYVVGTNGGLAVLEDNEIVPYYTKEKLNRVAVYSLFVSTNNRLWIGTNEGIFIWDENKLLNYNRSHGLIGDETNRNAFLQINKEKVWIGTELGASVYDVNKDISVEIIPNLKITSASTLEGSKLNNQSNILKYDDNTVEFHFIGVSFFDENQIKYRYKLNGFDNDYISINNPNANSVRYTNLPPNSYQFEVQSSIDSNRWSEPQTVRFTIEKPFYSTFWFQVLVGLVIIITLYSIYRIRVNLILKNQKKLKAEVRLRTEEIQSMNNEIQAQNEELMSQSEEIATNNERLEEIVQDRTQKLKEQNERLSKYAFMNSHELRGPICRMIGLLNVLKISKKEDHSNILNLIQQTGLELDSITRQINQTLDIGDLNVLYDSNSLEQTNSEIKAKQQPEK